MLLSACGRDAERAGRSQAGGRAEAAGYLAPPTATRFADGLLSGTAAPGARLRLATPAGEALSADVGPDGRWQMRVSSGVQPRIYGLSLTSGGRQVQSEGYLLVSPRGQAAVLRAGGGSARLDPLAPGLGVLDFDRGGGAVVSGTAPPGAVVLVRLDGTEVGEARSGDDGRFSLALPPIGGGPHRLQVFGDGFQDAASISANPSAPLAGGPLRSQFIPGGLRADWLTPGGGVQSTVLID
jgi:hypothetical protein